MTEKIAIQGSPGTGKTELALALQEALGADDWVVIDNIATDLAAKYKLHTGSGADYLPNLMVFLQRALREREVTLSGKNSITIGTDIETMAYIGVQIELYSHQPKTDTVKRQMLKNMHAAAVISMAIEDMWSYDYVFYRPVPERFKIEIPGDISSVERYEEYYVWVDEAVAVGNLKWGLNPDTLTGTIDAQVAQAMGTIESLREKKEGKNGGGSE